MVLVHGGVLLPVFLNGKTVECGDYGDGRVNFEVGEVVQAIGGRHADRLGGVKTGNLDVCRGEMF